MPLPDICLNTGDNEGSSGIGVTPGVGGGVGPGVITPGDGVAYPGVIGNMPCNRPVIATVTSMKRKFVIQIKDANDVPQDLTEIDHIKFFAKETYDAAKYYLEKDCTITDATEGIIELKFGGTDTPYSGVWWAGFHLID